MASVLYNLNLLVGVNLTVTGLFKEIFFLKTFQSFPIFEAMLINNTSLMILNYDLKL